MLVQSETSDFGFKVQDWSNFRFFRAVDESSILMPQRERGASQARRFGGNSAGPEGYTNALMLKSR